MESILEEEKKIIDSYLEEALPRKFDRRWLDSALGEARWEHDIESYTKAIAEPGWELLGRGGKRWRPFLMLMSYRAVSGRNDSVGSILALPELIHNGTLIIDDIEDSSSIRRGKRCVHKIFGDDIAINAGNSLYYLPCLLIARSRGLSHKVKVRLYETVMEEMVKLSLGQGTDIYWHRSKKSGMNEGKYLQMCAYKTGGLARMSAKLGAIIGNASDKKIISLAGFAESLGVAFQIQDDILNITSTALGKDFGEDITEGKRTLLVIHALKKASPEDRQLLLGILNQKTRDKTLISEAISIIKKYRAIDYSKNIAKRLVKDAWHELDPLLKESKSKKILKMLAQFTVNRKV